MVCVKKEHVQFHIVIQTTNLESCDHKNNIILSSSFTASAFKSEI